jgi:Predicted Rossmann fold nucleotide-binding protein
MTEDPSRSSPIRSVCVYCGSSKNARPVFQETARETGHVLVRNGWNLVYGGARVGLMGIVADSVLSQGGEVTGVMPGH